MTRSDVCLISLNNAEDDGRAVLGAGVALALNAEGALPEWAMLIPKGPSIVGSDGRAFTLEEPQEVVEAFNAAGRSLPIDINHAEFLKAPMGEESPAAGWIEALEVRDGAIWGRVAWTPDGAAALNARRYRYLSPALRTDKSGKVLALAGAGLVNRPNFSMPALNAEKKPPTWGDLLLTLGLAETATIADAIAAASQLNAAKTPSLDDYVPRADYDVALNARNEAERQLAGHLKAAREAEMAALVDGAIHAGKIAPATRTAYLEMCATEGGVEAVKKFIAAQPSMFTTSGLDEKPLGGGETALNADERVLVANMGLTEAEFLAARQIHHATDASSER